MFRSIVTLPKWDDSLLSRQSLSTLQSRNCKFLLRVSKFNIACQYSFDFFFIYSIVPIDKFFYSNRILLLVITSSFIALLCLGYVEAVRGHRALTPTVPLPGQQLWLPVIRAAARSRTARQLIAAVNSQHLLT